MILQNIITYLFKYLDDSFEHINEYDELSRGIIFSFIEFRLLTYTYYYNNTSKSLDLLTSEGNLVIVIDENIIKSVEVDVDGDLVLTSDEVDHYSLIDGELIYTY